jgi:hypothetical protein
MNRGLRNHPPGTARPRWLNGTVLGIGLAP